MSDNQVVRAWEEIVISQEKGNRIVHYILKDSTGNSLLAVVGKDTSVNHMSYVVSEDYLRVFGPTGNVHARTKWRSRRDVVNSLVWVVSRGGPILAHSTSPYLKFQVSPKSNNGQETTGKIEGSGQPAITQASKRTTSCTLDTNVVSHASAIKHEPNHKRLKTEVSSKMPNNIIKPFVAEPQGRVSSKFNKNIELLSQDSGLQGCWFRCKIVHSSQDHLKIRYKDVLEVDGSRKLEDWIPSYRKAAPDKLGVRCVGRLRVRPSSACENSSDTTTFVVGASVDAWWCNGWWEGVVIGCDTLGRTNFQVYFPARVQNFRQSHFRPKLVALN